MPAPVAIQQLVENFATHIEHYKSADYNETELRREYLDPFWKALGWDIDNTLKQLETRITATDPCFALRATQDAAA